MACQLSDAGERVVQVAVIESGALNAGLGLLRPLVGDGTSADALEVRGRRLRFARIIRNRVLRVARMSWRARADWFTRNVRRVLGRHSVMPPAPLLDARPEEFEHRPGTNLLRVQGRAAAAYIPRPYDGRMDLLLAVEPDVTTVADDLSLALGGSSVLADATFGTRGWGRVASRVRAVGVRASHVGIITEQLPVLAECLRASLTDAESPPLP